MLNNFTKSMIHQMARKTGTPLTRRHWEILDFAYGYYRRHKVGPLFYVLQQQAGASQQELDTLFPAGLQSVYLWTGIPIQSPSQLCKPLAEIQVADFRHVYFDHNATTYLREEVRRTLLSHFQAPLSFGNPSSSTHLGKAAADQVHQARARIARTLKVSPSEIFFTGSGSEANNLAIKGAAFRHLETGGHIISSRVEHASVLETLKWLAGIGFKVTLLDVEPDGRVSPEAVRSAIREETILVAIMAANNEIGTIMPLGEIGPLCRARGIPVMTDAVQAYGKIPLHPKESGIRMLSLSGHKIYAPKGVGAIFVDESLSIVPLIHGGEQEMGLRSGTENVGYIMALGQAAELAHREMKTEAGRLRQIQERFLSELKRHVPNARLNGPLTHRLPNNLNIGFPNVDSGALLLSLDQIGIYVSSGSACSAGSKETSHVIRAIGVDTERYGILRFSFGRRTTESDIDYLFTYLPEILRQLRQPG